MKFTVEVWTLRPTDKSRAEVVPAVFATGDGDATVRGKLRVTIPQGSVFEVDLLTMKQVVLAAEAVYSCRKLEGEEKE